MSTLNTIASEAARAAGSAAAGVVVSVIHKLGDDVEIITSTD